MTGSRAERRLAAALAAALVMLGPALSWGQGGAPLSIVPPDREGPPAEEGPGGILIEPLPEADFASAGTLSKSEGGLGADLWAGTDRAVVARHLPELPARPGSPTAYDLQRRLLLTPARVPRGLEVGHDLLTLRAERLHAMGALDGLIELVDLVPPGGRSELYARVEVETWLAAGEIERACTAAGRHVRGHDDALFNRVLAVCHVLRGEADMAVFALDLLREQGGADKRYLTLLAALRDGGGGPIDSLPDPAPLELVMLREAGRALPPDARASLSPLALRAVLRAGDLPPEVRVDLAEDGVLRGLVPVVAYDAAMDAAAAEAGPRAPQALRALAEQAVDDYPETGVALRIRAHASAMAEALPARRARILAEIWDWQAEHYPADRLMAVATAGPLAGVKPVPEHGWLARRAAETLYLVGRREAADRWYALLDRIGAVAELSALWPLAHLSDPDVAPWTGARLRAWHANASARDPGEAARRAAVLFAGVDAIDGGGAANGHWRGILEPARAEDIANTVPRAWRHARGAAFEGRRGEALLLALGALGERSPAALDPAELRTLTRILAAVGLGREARSIAIEAFLGRGA